MTVKSIKIGTRGSPLALKQTEMVRGALAQAYPELETEVVTIKTSGDWSSQDGETRLSEQDGGKGQFAKEIEDALLAGAIDCAVHSMKDMDSALPDGLIIDHMLPREDPRDALLGQVKSLSDLPQGATIGTASVRRQAMLLSVRPDLNIEPMRGNVQTRIDKLRGGQVDATLLAVAGLNRLGLANEIGCILSADEMLPAAGQGAVGIELRVGDTDNIAIFSQISCEKTALCVAAERTVLQVLDGSCHTPIGVFAELDGEQMRLRAAVLSQDGQDRYFEDHTEAAADMEAAKLFGLNIGQTLKNRLPEGFLS